MASIHISPDPNQSFCSPRSRRICSVPIATLNVAKPNQSSFSPAFLGDSRRKAVMPK